MIKAHKIRFHPTPEQAACFGKATGTTRFVWNWALAAWNRQYAVSAALKEGSLSKVQKQKDKQTKLLSGQ